MVQYTHFYRPKKSCIISLGGKFSFLTRRVTRGRFGILRDERQQHNTTARTEPLIKMGSQNSIQTLPYTILTSLVSHIEQATTLLFSIKPVVITMPQMSFITTAVVIVIVAALYQLGLFDWPAFEESTLEPRMHVLLASTNSKDIPGNVERLLVGTREAIETVAKDRLAPAAAAYGAPEGAAAISVGLYVDNPNAVEHPRWGLGWAIQVDDDPELLAEIHAKVSQASILDEPIRLVTLGGGSKVPRARIPWRIMLTPAIAPMLHWDRGFRAYQKGGYSSNSGRDGDEGSIACEVYVTGPNDSMAYIDYTVLMGDTHEIFDAMFPLEKSAEDAPIEERETAYDL